MAANVAELVKDIEGAARIVAVLREILPAPEAPPVRWTLLQEDVVARLGVRHAVAGLLILRRLVDAGLVELVLDHPGDIPRYRRVAAP